MAYTAPRSFEESGHVSHNIVNLKLTPNTGIDRHWVTMSFAKTEV